MKRVTKGNELLVIDLVLFLLSCAFRNFCSLRWRFFVSWKSEGWIEEWMMTVDGNG